MEGSANIVRDSTLNIDSGRKIPPRTEESHLDHQRCGRDTQPT